MRGGRGGDCLTFEPAPYIIKCRGVRYIVQEKSSIGSTIIHGGLIVVGLATGEESVRARCKPCFESAPVLRCPIAGDELSTPRHTPSW